MDKISINGSNEETEKNDNDIIESSVQEVDENEMEKETVDNNEDKSHIETTENTVEEISDETSEPIYEQKKKDIRSRKSKKKNKYMLKKLITSLVILAIIVLITFFSYKGLRFLASLITANEQILTKSQEISMTSTGTLDYEKFGDGMLVANSGVISYLNSDLETVWEKPGFEGIPVISQNGKYAIVTYTDTSNAILVSVNDAIPVECPGKIVSACVNKNGYFAVIMTEDGFKNQISVYDNSANVFYKWHSSENYVTGVALSPDNKSMCATTVGFTENGFDSGVLMFDFAQGSPVSGQQQNDNLIMKVDYVSKNKIVVVGDRSTSFYKVNGNKISDVSYGDKKLVTFDITDSDKTILCFSDDDSATSDSEIYSYNSNGKLNGKLDIVGRILSVSSCDDKVLISKDGTLELLSDNCKRLRSASIVRDLKNSVLFDDAGYAFIISGNLAQVLKIG